MYIVQTSKYLQLIVTKCTSEVDASPVKISALISSWQQKYSNSKAPGCTVNNSLPKAMEVGGNHLGLTPLHTVGFLDFMILYHFFRKHRRLA